MLWEVEIHPADGQIDREGERVQHEADALGADSVYEVRSARSYLVEGNIDESQVNTLVRSLLVDDVVETANVHRLPGDRQNGTGDDGPRQLLNVLFKPGVTDNVAFEYATTALVELGPERGQRVATGRKYWFNGDSDFRSTSRRSSSDVCWRTTAIEQVHRRAAANGDSIAGWF